MVNARANRAIRIQKRQATRPFILRLQSLSLRFSPQYSEITPLIPTTHRPGLLLPSTASHLSLATIPTMDAASASTRPQALASITRATDSSIEQQFRFLDLPAELRICVYDCLVLVGKVFFTPDAYAVASEKRFKDWRSYRVPSLQILRVCKQVHGEAEELYLSKNLFVLPDFCNLREPIVRDWQDTVDNMLPPDGHCSLRMPHVCSRISAFRSTQAREI